METIIENIESALRRASVWSIIVAIAAVICGVLAVLSPAWGAYVATVVFGVTAVVAGVFELGYAWRTRKDNGAFWRFVISLAYLVAGIYVLANLGIGMAALALAFGVMMLVRGVMLLMLTYDLRRTHVWGWYLFDAVVSLILGGLVLAAWPAGSIIYLGLWFGIGLIFNGVHRFSEALALRRILPPSKPRPLTAAHA
jgi:uncharacterized membrane protein HdeD (DUF308 family)